jgi:hypothetical protein
MKINVYTLQRGGFMKKLSLVIVTLLISIVLVVSFFSGCALVEPQANVTITSADIGSYAADDWYMDISFTIANTGLYNIVSYDITFEVTCTDSTPVNDVYWGSFLAMNDSYSDVFRVDTYSKEPDTAQVANLVLEME